MAKAISSAVDVLAAISGKTELFETNGITVELRSLDWAEIQAFATAYADNSTEMAFQMALAGLGNPKLSEEQLRKAAVSFVINVGRRVGEMSGMTGTSDGPLAGDGSSSS